MSTLASTSFTARDELPCSLGARSAGDDDAARKPSTSVGLHPDTWTHILHRILAADRTIRVGWFHSIDRQLVSLHTARAQYDLELLVIPPDTPTDVAAAAMVLAVRGRQSELPADIPATRRAGVAGSATAVAVGVWEDDGGRLVTPVDRAPVGPA